jgi:hypothetical protein
MRRRYELVSILLMSNQSLGVWGEVVRRCGDRERDRRSSAASRHDGKYQTRVLPAP